MQRRKSSLYDPPSRPLSCPSSQPHHLPSLCPQADEFFHKYFQLTKQNKPKKKVKRGSDDEMDSGASSGDSDQEDAFLERAEQHTSMGSAPSSGVYDYADLGKAMGRAEKGTGEEEEEGSGVDDDDFDGNVMDLPSPSLSEDDGREEAAGDSDQEDDALAELAKGDDSSDDVEEEEERRGQQKRDSAGRGEAVFASAEDFAEEIEAALARQGRDQGGQGPAGKRKQQEGRSGSPGKPRHPKGRPAKKTKTQRGRKAGS